MNKITFVNNQAPALNANNLNLMQTYIETAINDTKADITELEASEKEIGKWIDDKPLYRKIIDIGNLPNNSETDIDSGLIATDVDVRKIYGIATSNTSVAIPLPYIATSYVSIALLANGKIQIITNSNRSAFSGYVILEYTKKGD